MKSYRYFIILTAIFIPTIILALEQKPSIKIITPTKSEKYIVSRPTIKASFHSKNTLKSVKLYVNNKDVTKNSKISKNSISYRPPKKLKRGTQIVRLVVSDKYENTSSTEWYFTVGTPIYKIYKLDKDYICDLNSPSDKLRLNFRDLKIKNTSTTLKVFALNGHKFAEINKNDLAKEFSKLDEINCILSSDSLNALDYMKYSLSLDKFINQIDISEGLSLYNEALDNGWHVSPYNPKAFNYILSTDLNRDDLFDGFVNRRTYASDSDSISLEFSINGLPMGSTVKAPSKLNFSIGIVDKAPQNKIKNILLINKGTVVKNIPASSNLEKLEFTLKEFEKNSYYYLIIIQEGQKLTVSAPIWISTN